MTQKQHEAACHIPAVKSAEIERHACLGDAVHAQDGHLVQVRAVHLLRMRGGRPHEVVHLQLLKRCAHTTHCSVRIVMSALAA